MRGSGWSAACSCFDGSPTTGEPEARRNANSTASVQRHPLWIGIVLSGANPYFLLWWATVGLTLTSQAMEFGILALVLFAMLHWMCDLGWLEVLSLAGFKGSAFGNRSQKLISVACAVMLLGFGVKFVFDAGVGLLAVHPAT